MSTSRFKVKAIYEYSSPHEDDLSFPEGQIISITAEEDDEWYEGEYTDNAGTKHEGIFPKNFVEKFEPEIPSRPIRPSKVKKDAPVAPESHQMSPTNQAEPEKSAKDAADLHERTTSPERPVENPMPSDIAAAPAIPTGTSSPKPPLQRAPPSSDRFQEGDYQRDQPPQPAEKPTTGSFKDKIAAFNKQAASPIAPGKSGGPNSRGAPDFVKKPFVAPPPSKNSYVPASNEQPPTAKAYGKERESEPNEFADDSEASMPLSNQKESVMDEKQPKPTSLKDRIALLQKQQLEQAARHAEAAQKKEKPKKSTKRQTGTLENTAGDSEVYNGQTLPGSDAVDNDAKRSVDFAEGHPEVLHGTDGLTHVAMSTPPPPAHEFVSDTNDADSSGAGDTEEADDTSTSREDDHERARTPEAARLGSGDRQPGHEEGRDGEDSEDAEEDEQMDPEVRRRMEIRERMAKMSGGMGLMGMFGPPSTGPKASTSAAKSRTEVGTESSAGAQTQSDAVQRAAPIPVPGMSQVRPAEQESSLPKDPTTHEGAASQNISERQQTTEVDAYHEGASSMAPSETRPPVPTSRIADAVPAARDMPPPPPPRHDGRKSLPKTQPDPSSEQPISPLQGRPVPLPPSRKASMPLSPGELSDDEMSLRGSLESPVEAKASQSQPRSPDVPMASPGPSHAGPEAKGELSPTILASPGSPIAKGSRANRPPPPPPPSAQSPTTTATAFDQTRPPPPVPSGPPPTRRSTSQARLGTTAESEREGMNEEEVTEYDGDYDTDIASSARHKEALKSHARDSSQDDETLTEHDIARGTQSPPTRGAPPLPNPTLARETQHQPAPIQDVPLPQRSKDMPRAPPPLPPSRESTYKDYEGDYDPYRYDGPLSGAPSPSSEKSLPMQPLGNFRPEESSHEPHAFSRAPPTRPMPASPPSLPPQPPDSPKSDPRRSHDVGTRPAQTPRRSMDVGRASTDQAYIASDVDLAQDSKWYMQTPDAPPRALQGRNDVLCEIESSTNTKRGGKTTISKDVYVLYMDYSQTTITAIFDASKPDDVTLEQSHQRPPVPPRQDQLESAYNRFGAIILKPPSPSAASLTSKSSTSTPTSFSHLINTIVGDGTPQALITHLLQPLSHSVLLPVGQRAYGAVIYANLANASTTQQSDQIRPGDVVTFRNAKFAGHRGGLHTKYAIDVGKPDHVAVVIEWDGTKRKIRVLEQKGKDGKESKDAKDGSSSAGGGSGKVKEESYRMADLKSGEVRVWRVMGRDWVGWDSNGGTGEGGAAGG